MRFQPSHLERMKEAIGGDAEVLVDIVRSFVDEAEALSRRLLVAAAENDAATAGMVAHTMKSSARDFGDEELALLCARLEHEARSGQVAGLESQAAAVARACLMLRDDLAFYISGIPGAVSQ